MQDIQTLVDSFDVITLEQMDNVKLMSRTDTKYAFERMRLSEILSKMIDHYRILEVDNVKAQQYNSLYFDTKDRLFYINHHNQRVNRNKVRFRQYKNSGLTFLEVKTKNNKGRTVKKRIKVDKIPSTLSDAHNDFIKTVTGKKLDVYAKQWIQFTRLTFAHKSRKERLTIDLDLTFSNERKEGNLKEIVIAEVKEERMSRLSDFVRITKEMSILPMRLSKYCVSTTQLEPNIKKNRFKKKLLFIDKLKK